SSREKMQQERVGNLRDGVAGPAAPPSLCLAGASMCLARARSRRHGAIVSAFSALASDASRSCVVLGSRRRPSFARLLNWA
ncbi:MAG: hypothetical protein ACPIOQ_67890, partial [Promethearchaeia archaeon]